MRHIDIIGPPGAGKSTILENLTKTSNFKTKYSINELLFLNIPGSELISNRILPSSVSDKIGRIHWKYSLEKSYLQKFKNEYPDAAEIITQAGRLDDRMHYPRMYEKAAAELFFFLEYVNAPFVLDESLTQLSAEVLHLDKKLGNSYLSVIPAPDTVIVVDCPSKICLERQQNREKALASSVAFENKKKAINRLDVYRSQFETVSRQLQARGTQVITINSNNDDPDTCTEKLLERLNDPTSTNVK